jgi:hypothetical protein
LKDNSILRTGGRYSPIIARLLIDVMRAFRPDLIDLHECLRCIRTSVRTVLYMLSADGRFKQKRNCKIFLHI